MQRMYAEKYEVLDSGASNHFVQGNLEKYISNVKVLPNNVPVHIAILKTNKSGVLTTKCQGQTLSIEALIVPKI